MQPSNLSTRGIDWAAYADPESARLAVLLAMESDPDVLVFFGFGFSAWSLDLIRLANAKNITVVLTSAARADVVDPSYPAIVQASDKVIVGLECTEPDQRDAMYKFSRAMRRDPDVVVFGVPAASARWSLLHLVGEAYESGHEVVLTSAKGHVPAGTAWVASLR